MRFLAALLAFSCLFTLTNQKPQSLLERLVAKDDVTHDAQSAVASSPARQRDVIGVARRSRRQTWDYRKCQQLAVLMQKKSMAIRKIEARIEELQPNSDVDPHDHPMRHLQADALRILVQELEETESMIWQSFRWLEEVLSGGDYSSVLSLTGNAWKRLDALRHATLKEEEEYNALVKAEESLQKANHTHVKGVIDDFLHEVSNVADDLEAKVDEHIFKDTVHMNESEHIDGFDIETVVRVPYARAEVMGPGRNRKSRSLSVRLIDSNENQFVLSRAKDTTMPQVDRHLIQDLILLWTVATACGWFCCQIQLPSILGYVLGGMMLGPAVTGNIQCIVQVETFGEIGIFFILFIGGLEFSPSAVKKVIRVSVICTLFSTLFLSVLGLFLGLPWSVSISECVFVASCLSLSSSTLVFRFLDSANASAETDRPEVQVDCRSILLGILVMQKVFLGVLMALIPSMAESNTSLTDLVTNCLYVALVLLGLTVFLLLCSRFRDSEILSRMHKHRKLELITVTLASFLFICLVVTEHLRVSMELGCLFAGLVISVHSQSMAEEVADVVKPVRDIFACLFFATIGLHIYPQFLAQELLVVAILTVATVFAKYILFFVSLTLLVHPRTQSASSCVRWLVPSALSHVSECSFVLGSRARKLGLISREVYLLILGVTSLSFLLAPILWNVSISNIRRRLLMQDSHAL